MIQAIEMAPQIRQTSDAAEHPLDAAPQVPQRERLPTAAELRQTLSEIKDNAQTMIALAQTLLAHKPA